MLVTGVILIAFTKGAFGCTLWIRASLVLFVLLGLLLGYVQRLLRRAMAALPSVMHLCA